jgi:hypothetical protein
VAEFRRVERPEVGDMNETTSYPTIPRPGKVQPADSSLANQFQANVFPYENNPAVFNESPSMKKSYSWNRGEYGNGNGPR